LTQLFIRHKIQTQPLKIIKSRIRFPLQNKVLYSFRTSTLELQAVVQESLLLGQNLLELSSQMGQSVAGGHNSFLFGEVPFPVLHQTASRTVGAGQEEGVGQIFAGLSALLDFRRRRLVVVVDKRPGLQVTRFLVFVDSF